MKKPTLKTAVISITLCTMLSLFFSYASLEKTDDSSKFIENFFSIYEKEGGSAAVDYAAQSNPYLAEESSMDSVKIKLTNVEPLLGTYDGYEIIGKRTIGNSLVNYICLAKYDRQPLRFNFLLYKAKDKWALQNFQVSGADLGNEILDMSKFYYIETKQNGK